MRKIFLYLVISIIFANYLFAESQDTFPIEKIDEEMQIVQISEDVFVVQHFFPWVNNSMVYFPDSVNVLIVDTPCTPEAMIKVLDWIGKRITDPEITVINTHYHIDCLGGNQALIDRNITVYASDKSVELIDKFDSAKDRASFDMIENEDIRNYYRNFHPVKPNHIFRPEEGMILSFGDIKVLVAYPGPAHTIDNVIVYIYDKKIMYAGCIARPSLTMGYMGEADPKSWLKAMDFLAKYPVRYVIPGHGGLKQKFSPELLDLTRKALNLYIEEGEQK